MDAALIGEATAGDEAGAPARASRMRTPLPSWTAVAAILLSVALPVCGWMVSLSNRIATLEEKTASLATAAQMAEVKQKIEDWIEASDRARGEQRYTDQHFRMRKQ